MNERWSRRTARIDPLVLFVTIATALGAALLLGRFASTSGLGCDELLFLRAIGLGPIEGLMASGSSHPPLMRWILAPFVGSSWSDGALRSFPVACAAASVFAWSAILSRVFVDRLIVCLLLPASALNAAWTGVAYQLTPYALLGLLAALHLWSWFPLLARPTWKSGWLFVASAVLAAGTHFFGLGLLVADLGVWLTLLATSGLTSLHRRAWRWTSITAAVLVLPVLPILLFYVRNDRPYPLVAAGDPHQLFLPWSRQVFEATTLYRADAWALAWVVMPAALALLAGAAWRARAVSRGLAGTALTRSVPVRAAVLACAGTLGLQANQAFALLTRSVVAERYVAWTAWAHLAVIVFACTLLPGEVGRWAARMCAVAALGLGVARYAEGTGARRKTQDWTPSVQLMATRRAPGDAFFVQDMDLWSGEGNFDRLWFERYGRGLMPVVHGSWMKRIDMYRQGLPLDALAPSIRRVWVFSHLFSEDWFARMPRANSTQWRVLGGEGFEHGYCLALLARTER